jgi:hypothetical protein
MHASQAQLGEAARRLEERDAAVEVKSAELAAAREAAEGELRALQALLEQSREEHAAQVGAHSISKESYFEQKSPADWSPTTVGARTMSKRVLGNG